jgi:hypothetical protein
LLDAARIAKDAWDALEPEAIARCWLKADILPMDYQLELRGTCGMVHAASKVVGSRQLDDLTAAFRGLSIPAGSGDPEVEHVRTMLANLHTGGEASSSSTAEQEQCLEVEDSGDVHDALQQDDILEVETMVLRQ